MSDSFTSDETGTDRITETTSKNIFQRIGGAIVAAAFGILLFIVAIGVLAWNESRAVDAIRGLGQAAHDVVEASPSPIAPAQNGRLVHLTGPLVAHGAVDDPEMGVTRDKVVHLRRKVEMYQWAEHKESHSTSGVGGTQTTQTTYTYSKKWSDEPIDSSNFRGDHGNPDMPIKTQVFTAADVTMGERKLSPKLLDELDAYTAIAAPERAPDGYRREGGSLYKGRDPEKPAIGDIRVTFAVVPAQTVSLLAEQQGTSLSPFKTKSGYRVGLVVPGTVDADEMVATKRSEEKTLTWILRIVGFVCFFVSLLLLASPLTVAADVIPLIGTIVGGGAFLFALVLAIPLTLATIAVAWIVVRPLLGLGLLAVAAVIVVGFHRLRSRRGVQPARA